MVYYITPALAIVTIYTYLYCLIADENSEFQFTLKLDLKKVSQLYLIIYGACNYRDSKNGQKVIKN